MSALRFLYKKTLNRRDIAYDDLIFPKTSSRLPAVLSPEEVARMIEAAPSLLHRTILMVLYATGIRRTEEVGPSDREGHQVERKLLDFVLPWRVPRRRALRWSSSAKS